MADNSRLYNRLKYLRENKPKTVEKKRTAENVIFEGWDALGDHTLYRTVHHSVSSRGIAKGLSVLYPHGNIRDVLFLDTETTGLSVGAGSTIFLIGFGSFAEPVGDKPADDDFVIEQYFLTDFPGEEEFLSIIRGKFDDSKLYVTYNGKAYDTQLLRSRFLLHGINLFFLRQLDLLYTARRVFKGMIENCSLSVVERDVLGKERTEDIPGYLVPDTYFNFLRTGSPAGMLDVFEHNREDIHSLAGLLIFFGEQILNPFGTAMVNRFQVGRFLMEHGMPQGEALLLSLFQNIQQEQELFMRHECRKATEYLSLMYKRQNEWDKAVELWWELFEKAESLLAAVELAKYYEHRMKDFHKAKVIVKKAMEMVKKYESRWDFEHRARRLSAKLARLGLGN